MQITNKFNLPKTLVNSMERDDYSMGEARMSVTGLLKPPRIGLLFKKHSRDVVSDVSDNIWSLFGRAIHKILESGGDEEHLPEERLFITVRGWIISGALDVQKLGDSAVKIVDYKSTSAWAVMNGKGDWVTQLNTYAHLIRVAKDMEVRELAVCAFVRDWSRHEAAANPEYPQSPATMIDIPLWSVAEASSFIEERVRVHQAAQAAWDMGMDPPECTDEERWMRKSSYAVKKTGNKRPTKTFPTMPAAVEYRDAMIGKGGDYSVETRKGEPIRCTGDYCHVSQWCKQYAQWQKDKA